MEFCQCSCRTAGVCIGFLKAQGCCRKQTYRLENRIFLKCLCWSVLPSIWQILQCSVCSRHVSSNLVLTLDSACVYTQVWSMWCSTASTTKSACTCGKAGGRKWGGEWGLCMRTTPIWRTKLPNSIVSIRNDKIQNLELAKISNKYRHTNGKISKQP